MDKHIFTRLIVSPTYGVKLVLLDENSVKIYDKYRWHVCKYGNTFYVVRDVRVGRKRKTILLHREFMKPPPTLCVDHWNKNGLDNRFSNLRICTHTENNHNQGIRKDNTSGVKGVSWHKQSEKWQAQIKMDGKNIHVGYFDNIEDARIAVEAKRLEFHGDFACNG